MRVAAGSIIMWLVLMPGCSTPSLDSHISCEISQPTEIVLVPLFPTSPDLSLAEKLAGARGDRVVVQTIEGWATEDGQIARRPPGDEIFRYAIEFQWPTGNNLEAKSEMGRFAEALLGASDAEGMFTYARGFGDDIAEAGFFQLLDGQVLEGTRSEAIVSKSTHETQFILRPGYRLENLPARADPQLVKAEGKAFASCLLGGDVTTVVGTPTLTIHEGLLAYRAAYVAVESRDDTHCPSGAVLFLDAFSGNVVEATHPQDCT